jgi:hypothetical protein
MGEWLMTVERTFEFENTPSIDDFQLQIRNSEVRLKLKSLEYREAGSRKFTHAVFERVPKTPRLPLLRLVLDPNETEQAGANENLVCKGTAVIEGGRKKVAAFRPKT